MRTIMLLLISLMLAACANLAPPVSASEVAQQQEQADPVIIAAAKLPKLFNDEISAEDYFADSFLRAVPSSEVRKISDGLIAEYGRAQMADITRLVNPTNAEVSVEFERGIVEMKISAGALEPHRVTGLLITGSRPKDDSADRIDTDFGALEGQAGYLVARLGAPGGTEILAGRNIARQFAIGSTFKLYILAELASQVKAGKRSWSDVVPLTERSFSSPATNRWPDDAPVTLQTLASMMISKSDNSASDTLLNVLGREQVEAKLAAIGHGAPDKALPFLSTVEAFALKSNPVLASNFIAGSEAAQRKMLSDQKQQLGLEDVDLSVFDDGPVMIDSVEWFASPVDLTELLDHIRTSRNDRMMRIMAINSGIGDADAARWNYLGYKGGSEPGVISMSFLTHSRAGNWYAITGSWNNDKAEVDEGRFTMLMTRLLNSYADQ